MQSPLYPLKFQPILKEKIWGGEKLHQVLGKQKISNQIGESWEISAVENDVSVVANGVLKGKSLREIVEAYKADLVGKKVYHKYANNFPLLIKFIDATEDLSVQVHPGDKIAQQRHNSFGKTEMWYVLDAEENASIVAGFHKNTSKEDYLEALEQENLEAVLNKTSAKSGDTFLVKAGLVHAIGKGVLLAEIQQTSDITYRIYDYNRTDKEGNKRELHTEDAIDAIDFDSHDYRVAYTTKNNQLQDLVSCKYFNSEILQLENTTDFKLHINPDSFVILIGVEGKANIKHHQITIKKGETVLIPANLGEISLQAESSKILVVTI
ncbi:type I phosphomannose isomerase catalytic subunit [Mesonia sp. K7]|uniref:type I phosphomannose isomerase catalytic subunit n=1 Tax=Mesonia sp. K7 TaxID=2218606 RepID=UPI000DA95BDA|nr:type I phosphomannose isomerase catalytic subunit [Mesonia sp. K7]PZD78093.1 mannose-6-phosphate isomerase [Mesonia sp. K7]